MSATQLPAADLATGREAVTSSVRPVVIPAPGRGTDLQVRVCAPLTGDSLPLVVFSHGFGFSMDAYGPLVDFWASHGFAVVAPTHLDSVSLGLTPDDPRTPRIWRHRIEDLERVLDELDVIEEATPGLAGRLDRSRVAVTGHSYGATTASALLGARVLAPAGDPEEDFRDERVTAGVLLCLAGLAGDELTPMARQMFPFMSPDFGAMSAPALIIAGDADQSALSTRGPDWWEDAYRLSPGAKSLITLFGAEHGLGGIDAHRGMPLTPAENPALVTLTQRMTTAYLRTALGVDSHSWAAAGERLAAQAAPMARLQSR